MKSRIHQLAIDELKVDVFQKNIKNIYLRVYQQSGQVRISAPIGMRLDAIREFVVSKRAWIQKKQDAMRGQLNIASVECGDGEQQWFAGTSYPLNIVEHKAPARVELKSGRIVLYVRPHTSLVKRQLILEEWYRTQLKRKIPEIIAKYESTLGVAVAEFGIKKMRTRWGTCNPGAKRIWLNLELAKRPQECLEYVVVHEMTHLIERRHNKRFYCLMDGYLPGWKKYKAMLHQSPLR